MSWYENTVRYKVSEGIKASHQWRELVTNFEGLRLDAYLDSVGVPTIGWGHTLGVKIGDSITHERAEELLYADVKRFELAVNRLVDVPLTQYQFDALTSFAFNLGAGNLKSSTLLRLLNDGNYSGAADEFTRWVYADGERLRGLVRRRKAEAEMFRGGNWLVYVESEA